MVVEECVIGSPTIHIRTCCPDCIHFLWSREFM